MKKRKRFCWEVHPVAVQENICAGENYRFTVLTHRLLRLEFDPEGIFEDRASQSVFYRNFPKTGFSVTRENGILTLKTDSLVLRYAEGKPFGEDTLSVRLKNEPASTWHYGEDFEDLGGTTQTLDMVNGRCAVERGICSRNGFSVLEDSHTLVLEKDGWIGVRRENTTDCYFFGYGFDYVAAVQDFYSLTGVPPMLPAYALGNWWSRYHAYTQQEYCDLIDRFRAEDVPFSVGVIDMDWHITKISQEQQKREPELRPGWTGYTWNKELFPDYKTFLQYLKERNLHTALNLHPASGVCCHEEMYIQMAEAMGQDPSTGDRVKFDILSPNFMEKYFDILHHPYEENGVDFWWMDWQQGTDYWWIHEPNAPGTYKDPRERLDPLWMLNHLHILDISRNGNRPMFFSRYSGPGSHRYPVGFSGDTTVTWESLAFQPEFTATSSNIGYAWWSHDIGGHMRGYRDDELTARWVQLGVFSPILRLHSTHSEFMSKEPWCYGPEAEGIMKRWLLLRHSLFPYIYTMNRRTAAQRLPLIQPMYYSHPKQSGAYEVPNQYWFGSELIAAPITEKRDEKSCMGAAEVWLPKGNWFDFFSGLRYASRRGRLLAAHRYLEDMPVFAKAGAIVPLAQYPKFENRLLNSEKLQLLVFPGASNSFTLYEDEGEGYGFRDGACAETRMELSWGEEAVLTLHPAMGDLTQIPEKRSWEIGLRGWHRDIQVTAFMDGKVCPCETRWDFRSNTFLVTVEAAVVSEITLRIAGAKLHDNRDVEQRCVDVLTRSQMSNVHKEELMKEIRSEESLRRKIYCLYKLATDATGVADALKELLCLTEDEYLGSQEV